MPVIRVPDSAVAVVVRGAAVGSQVGAITARLEARYSSVIERGGSQQMTTGDDVVVLLLGADARLADGSVLVWGTPWSSTGQATDADVVAAITDATAARQLTGRFAVLARSGPGAIRVMTSPDVVHSWKHVRHGDAEAWSTRGLAALAAVDAPVRLNNDAVAEYLLFDFVLCEEELARGVRLVEEASWTDVRASGATTASYWPRAERLARGAASTPEDLRAAVTAAAMPVTAANGASLGLTAGRDSVLVASCIADAGGKVRTFTMGDPRWPDAVGAQAVSAQLGWGHDDVTLGDQAAPRFTEAVRWSTWTEGLVLGRDIVGAPLAWPAGLRHALSGSGGEVGRAFWWSGAAEEVRWQQALLAPATSGMDDGRRAHLAARLAATLDALPVDGDARRLDALYAFGRMRSWLGRGRPIPGFQGTTAAFLTPAGISALMNLPDEQRSDASGFDRALGLGSEDLRAAASAAVAAAHARRSILTRVHNRLRSPVDGEVAALRRVLHEAGDALDPAREALGEPFWDHALATCDTATRHRLTLWNAVAVAAFVQACT